MNSRRHSLVFLSALGLAAQGCAVQASSPAPDAEAKADHLPNVGRIHPAIKEGTDVTQSDLYWRTTVSVTHGTSLCTGVIIGQRTVLTAAHCHPESGPTYVGFYLGNSGAPGRDSSRAVVGVVMPPGVDGSTLTDSSGNYADLAIVTLDRPIPPGYVPAELPAEGSSYLQDPAAVAVGVGIHDGNPNNAEYMRWRWAETASTDDSAGYFESSEEMTDVGDSGGPIYSYDDSGTGLIVVGILSASVWDWGFVDKYTSVESYWNLQWVALNGG